MSKPLTKEELAQIITPFVTTCREMWVKQYFHIPEESFKAIVTDTVVEAIKSQGFADPDVLLGRMKEKLEAFKKVTGTKLGSA